MAFWEEGFEHSSYGQKLYRHVFDEMPLTQTHQLPLLPEVSPYSPYSYVPSFGLPPPSPPPQPPPYLTPQHFPPTPPYAAQQHYLPPISVPQYMTPPSTHPPSYQYYYQPHQPSPTSPPHTISYTSTDVHLHQQPSQMQPPSPSVFGQHWCDIASLQGTPGYEMQLQQLQTTEEPFDRKTIPHTSVQPSSVWHPDMCYTSIPQYFHHSQTIPLPSAPTSNTAYSTRDMKFDELCHEENREATNLKFRAKFLIEEKEDSWNAESGPEKSITSYGEHRKYREATNFEFSTQFPIKEKEDSWNIELGPEKSFTSDGAQIEESERVAGKLNKGGTQKRTHCNSHFADATDNPPALIYVESNGNASRTEAISMQSEGRKSVNKKSESQAKQGEIHLFPISVATQGGDKFEVQSHRGNYVADVRPIFIDATKRDFFRCYELLLNRKDGWSVHQLQDSNEISEVRDDENNTLEENNCSIGSPFDYQEVGRKDTLKSVIDISKEFFQKRIVKKERKLDNGCNIKFKDFYFSYPRHQSWLRYWDFVYLWPTTDFLDHGIAYNPLISFENQFHIQIIDGPSKMKLKWKQLHFSSEVFLIHAPRQSFDWQALAHQLHNKSYPLTVASMFSPLNVRIYLKKKKCKIKLREKLPIQIAAFANRYEIETIVKEACQRLMIKVEIKSKSKLWKNNNTLKDDKVFSFKFLDEDGEIRSTCVSFIPNQFYHHIEAGKFSLILKGSLKLAMKVYGRFCNDHKFILENMLISQPRLQDDEWVPPRPYYLFSFHPQWAKYEFFSVHFTTTFYTSLSCSIRRNSDSETQKDMVEHSVELTLWGNICNAERLGVQNINFLTHAMQLNQRVSSSLSDQSNERDYLPFLLLTMDFNKKPFQKLLTKVQGRKGKQRGRVLTEAVLQKTSNVVHSRDRFLHATGSLNCASTLRTRWILRGRSWNEIPLCDLRYLTKEPLNHIDYISNQNTMWEPGRLS